MVGQDTQYNSCAPVVLFAYNRPEHTAKTLAFLQQCNLSEKTPLVVYLDGIKNIDDHGKQALILENLHNISHLKCFYSLVIKQREYNLGLTENIISGIGEVMAEYGRAIILEDDVLVAPSFLEYMNDALDFYKNEPMVWHISGWNFPVEVGGLPSTFLWRTALGWGWATWADRWNYYERDPQALIDEFDEVGIQNFNIYGSYNFWDQVISNATGKISTWAVFWYATIFKNGGLCLNPIRAMTTNIGFDGSGTHYASIEHSLPHDRSSSYHKDGFPIDLSENRKVVSSIIRFNNGLNNEKKSNQNKTNVDLKRLTRVSLSHHSHFSYLSEKKVAIFGTADLSLLIFQLLRLRGISVCAFLVSSPGQCKCIEGVPVGQSDQWQDFNPDIVINCIEGNHESVITSMLSDALPSCTIMSWRSL